MLVSLNRRDRPERSPSADPVPLLDECGARVVLGSPGAFAVPAAPLTPAAHTLFGPRGVCLVPDGGPLIVCDTGHHRLLMWSGVPAADNEPAELVIGQTGFSVEGRNAGADISAATLNVPTGVATDGHVLAVADAWNHRVLLWHGLPRCSNQPADVVLGQADFDSGLANRGSRGCAPDTLNWCYGVAIHGGSLLVADTGNRRVLVWHRIPTVSGAPADLVLGQNDFVTRDEGAGASAGAVGMRWPHAIAAAGGRLFVADAGSSRILVWTDMPQRPGTPCDFVLGQADMSGADHNRAAYDPTPAALNMPYGVTVSEDCLVVADTANSRLLGFDIQSLSMGCAAMRLAGQKSFADKGDNRWSPAARDSVCWPFSVAAGDRTLAIADSGNNRVLLWDLA